MAQTELNAAQKEQVVALARDKYGRGYRSRDIQFDARSGYVFAGSEYLCTLAMHGRDWDFNPANARWDRQVG